MVYPGLLCVGRFTLAMSAFASWIKHPSRFLSICLSAAALFLTACQSNNALPEGAVPPKMKVENIAITQDGDNPVFIITYTVEHQSATDLPLQQVQADVFIRNERVGSIVLNQENLMVPAGAKQTYTVNVPVNVGGQATVDSLANSSLITLQGSCAVSLIFSTSPNQNNFNPSSSYHGLIRVVK